MIADIMLGGLIGLLVKVAIVCVILWGIWELAKWAGVIIPRPVMIVFYVIAIIIVIILLANVLTMLI